MGPIQRTAKMVKDLRVDGSCRLAHQEKRNTIILLKEHNSNMTLNGYLNRTRHHSTLIRQTNVLAVGAN